MRAIGRHGHALVLITLGAFVAACGSSSTAPISPSTPAPAQSSAVSPSNNIAIAQNNPAIGCSILPGADATRGFGYQVQYRWAAASSADVQRYELYVELVGADLSNVDTFVTQTHFTDTECNAFVSDAHLQNWHWRVRPQDAQGQFGDWSSWATFEFSPCRLSDGTPCHAPE
ncbi:MAG TPA: hypothetical protein VFA27_15040 [Vicinamibacterales bacterium]|nr:hypothetical protein [Vicinamibacterales bacterium]